MTSLSFLNFLFPLFCNVIMYDVIKLVIVDILPIGFFLTEPGYFVLLVQPS